jgi:hypothetical protein
MQITLAGWPVGEGDDVVLVGAGGLAAAAGGSTGLGAGADDVLQFAAGHVAEFGVAVIARAPGDWSDRGGGDAQAGEEPLCAGSLVAGIGLIAGTWLAPGARGRVRGFRWPGVAAGSAGVGDGFAVLVDDSKAPSCSWME